MNAINFWPILVAAIVSFGINSLWYSPILFGREWLALQKISDKDIEDTDPRSVWILYVIHFILILILYCILAFAIFAANITSASDGAFTGFLAWLGFTVPILGSGLLWKKHSFILVLIEGIGYLVTFVIGGAIIGAWV